MNFEGRGQEHKRGLQGRTSGKEPAFQCRRHETRVQFLGCEDPLKEGMAIHSSILVWRISGTEQPGGLQSMGCKEYDLACTHGSTNIKFTADFF